MVNCPICILGSITNIESDTTNTILNYTCRKCGNYSITDLALDHIKDKRNSINNPKIAAYIRSRTIQKQMPITLSLDKSDRSFFTIQEIIDCYPSSISDRIDYILINLSKLSQYTGQRIPLHTEDYSLFYTDSINTDSMAFMIKILNETGFIETTQYDRNLSFADNLKLGIEIRLLAKGWDRIYTLSTTKVLSNQAFVAMSFNPELKQVYDEGIARAISECNFKPLRIDKEQHNEKICDKIILEIRRSHFSVCDFTDHKSGVYFEAGFALGLNIPIIWTCREDQIDKTHFDTRQYNHILWKTKEDLYENLKDRILATII